MNTPPYVLRASGISITVPSAGRDAQAVRALDLALSPGETLAIVGESGCGKSLTALALAGLLPTGVKRVGGQIELLGEDVTGLTEEEWRHRRSRQLGVVFQDPMSALNPVLTIGEQIAEAIHAHQNVSPRHARNEAISLLERVKIPKPLPCFLSYPHQLSGGMRQRAMIAIAIANRPKILIADEPTTALDATVQAEILDLLKDLQRESGMALILITHDLQLVSRWADRVAVMYAGKIVEERPVASLLDEASHPYSRALIAARPHRRPKHAPRQRLAEIPGRVPAPGDVGPGCAYAGRCDSATAECWKKAPALHQSGSARVWCHAIHAQLGQGMLELVA